MGIQAITRDPSKKSIQTMFYILFFFTVNMKILSVCPPPMFIRSGPWSNI
jgi:F0F1-type ATP synthase membrane subunit c/vacuolar-type H+-ATPase subunit K